MLDGLEVVLNAQFATGEGGNAVFVAFPGLAVGDQEFVVGHLCFYPHLLCTGVRAQNAELRPGGDQLVEGRDEEVARTDGRAADGDGVDEGVGVLWKPVTCSTLNIIIIMGLNKR